MKTLPSGGWITQLEDGLKELFNDEEEESCKGSDNWLPSTSFVFCMSFRLLTEFIDSDFSFSDADKSPASSSLSPLT
jgi:hypothetical protein